jgi:hypothetical protein
MGKPQTSDNCRGYSCGTVLKNKRSMRRTILYVHLLVLTFIFLTNIGRLVPESPDGQNCKAKEGSCLLPFNIG